LWTRSEREKEEKNRGKKNSKKKLSFFLEVAVNSQEVTVHKMSRKKGGMFENVLRGCVLALVAFFLAALISNRPQQHAQVHLNLY
jgi:hypothetical protein